MTGPENDRRLNDYRLSEVEKKVEAIEKLTGDFRGQLAVLDSTVKDLTRKVDAAAKAADRMSTALFGLAGSVIVAAITFAISHAG